MALSRRATSQHRPSRVIGCVAAVVALSALLALPALAAPAKWVKYAGAIEPSAEGAIPSEIRLAVKMKRRDGKLVPRLVRGFKSKAVPVRCPSGDYYYVDLDGRIGAGSGPDFYTFNSDIPVQRRKFSATRTDETSTSRADYTVTGAVPRRGPATGTVRIHYTTTEPSNGNSDCDSGTVGWSASRR